MSVKAELKRRAGLVYRRLLYSFVGYLLNRTNSRMMIECRPDSQYIFNIVPEYKTLLEGWVAGNWDNNAGDMTRFFTLYLNISQILHEGVPGDFAELGVYKGNSAVLLAHMARKQGRQLYLFDTFTGFDSRDLGDEEMGREVQFTDTSLAEVQKLVGMESVTYVEGFFPESAAKTSMPERLAVAHIDCDLHAPMKAGLECFYPRLSPGGIMFLHDYSSGYWPGAKKAIDDYFRNLPEKPILAPDKSGTAIIRKASGSAS